MNNHSVNISVSLRDGESSEKMIRKFLKKCKKSEIIREHLDKTSYYKSKSRKKRDKIEKNKHLRYLEEIKLQKKHGFR